MEALQQLVTIFQKATTNQPTKTIARTPLPLCPTAVYRQIPAVSPRVMPTTPPTTCVKPSQIPPQAPLPPQANTPNAPELPRVSAPTPVLPPLCRSLPKMAPNGPSPAPHRYPLRHPHRHPLRHQRHLQLTLQRARYANAAAFLAQHKSIAVVNPINGALKEYLHLMHGTKKSIWSNSLVKEFGHLAQGIGGRVEGTNKI